MKLMDFVIVLAIGFLVGLPLYLIVDSYLLTADRFSADIEVVHPINEDFSTDSTELFTDEDRVDYSSTADLNTQRNAAPFSKD